MMNVAAYLATVIEKEVDITKGKWILTFHPSVTSNSVSSIVCKYVARRLKLPVVRLGIRPSKKNKFYVELTHEERIREMRARLYYKGSSLKGKNVILIDDIIVTSSSIMSSANMLLKKGAASVHAFVYVKLKSKPINIEAKIANSLIEKRGEEFLVKIINEPDNIITNRALAFVLSTGAIERKNLMAKISFSKRNAFLKQLKIFSRFQAKVK